MAATVKAKAPAKRPARNVPAASAMAPDDGIIHLTTDPELVEERVPLFYIDDVAYTVPKEPGANVGLEFLHLSRTVGQELALDYLLGKLLGEEGYRALRNYDQLKSKQFQQICEAVARLTLGALELPKA